MLEKKENLFNIEKCMATQEKYNYNNNNNKILLLQCKKTSNEKFYFLVKNRIRKGKFKNLIQIDDIDIDIDGIDISV